MRALLCVMAVTAVLVGGAASANGVRPPTFQDLMTDSTLVVIGTVMTVEPRSAVGEGWATIHVERVLKGDHLEAISVATTSPVMELDPRCCVPGATYIMFLRPARPDSPLYRSVRGAYGVVWLGASPARSVAEVPR